MMALILILIGTFVVYLINRKKFKSKTIIQKIVWLMFYAICVLLGLVIFFEILHIIKYHEVGF